MIYKIQYTETAKQDLADIVLDIYAVSKDVDTAIRFVEELKASASRLDTFPFSAKPLDDTKLIHLNLRHVIAHDYLLFYKFDADANTIYIESILNGKTDYIKVLIDRLT